MRYIKFLFLTFVMLFVTTTYVSADDKCEPEMYMFGYAFSFNDSTLYLTKVQKVENVWVKSHNGFVIERETYTRQLQTYFENDGVKNMTCGISFAKDEKKVMKKFNKLKTRYTSKIKHLRLIMLTEADFKFTTIVPMQIDVDENKTKKRK